ncbi:MAG: histidine--tRNA ligase [Patescibacteria group bacterium]
MAKVKVQNYKGTRDFYPEDKRLQKYVFNIWRSVCERYGYEEVDAPMLEPLELYQMKNGANPDMIKDELYALTDKSGRDLVVRPEMTPTVSRMVAARRQELQYPARWYSIPNLWRYERPQKGRLREHWQLNVDIFGQDGLQAVFELLQIANDIVVGLGAETGMYTIRINSRKLVNKLCELLRLCEPEASALMQLIDKKAKMPIEEYDQKFNELVDGDAAMKSLINEFLAATSYDELPEELRNTDEAAELRQLLDSCSDNMMESVVYDPLIMRGFDYYTGFVFEVFNEDLENNRAMLGGGEYDGLVGAMGAEPLPTAGFGMGDVTAIDFMQSQGTLPELWNETDIYFVVLEGSLEAAQAAIRKLRQGPRINVAVDSTYRKLSKCLESADKRKIRYALICGENEVKSGQYQLKDLKTGETFTMDLDKIAQALR